VEEMKAAVWHGEKDIRVEDVELRPLKENEVKVKVAWAGICGSDLHEYQEGPVFIPVGEENEFTGEKAPLTMGHEFAGVIEEVGSKVTKYKAGDRVVINPTITRGIKPDEFDRYDGYAFIGLHSNGGFAAYANIPENNIYRVPDSLSLEEAALVEPSAVAVQAVKDSGLRFGDTVAIFGAGPIGLLTIVAARAAGASRIVVADLSQTRLDLAKKAGATDIINSGEKDAVQTIRDLVPGGVDVSFEVAGVAPTFKQALDATKARGIVDVISIFARPIEWNPMQLTNTGVSVTASIVYTKKTFQQTINLIASGQLKPQDVVTSHIQLEEIVEKGFEALTKDKSQAKILVKLSGEK